MAELDGVGLIRDSCVDEEIPTRDIRRVWKATQSVVPETVDETGVRWWARPNVFSAGV